MVQRVLETWRAVSSDVHQALLTVFTNDLDDDVGDIMTKSAGDIVLAQVSNKCRNLREPESLKKILLRSCPWVFIPSCLSQTMKGWTGGGVAT